MKLNEVLSNNFNPKSLNAFVVKLNVLATLVQNPSFK